ncbi:MAG: hypothetical protein EBX52_05035 [Proteobacteria bacterium]|nr:hypothetical protein [Pseudomonadota bacterium]
MSHLKSLSILALTLVVGACSSTSKTEIPAHDPTVVQTDKGYVRGVFRNGALEFRGIPYAESTAGKNRWTMPKPRTPWSGILDASKFGSACPQVARYNLTEASSDEDCLFVNVSVPQKSIGKGEKLPVFVWIHGGAFVGGGSNLYVGYDVQGGAKLTPETFPFAIQKMYGQTELEKKRNAPAKIAKEYKLKAGDVAAERIGTLMSDYIPTPGINNCMYHFSAGLLSKVNPVYAFEFADRDAPVLGVGIAPPDPGFKMGAVHSSELNYLFPNLDNTSKINAPDLAPASQKLADQMIGYWSSFIKTGVPSAPGAPKWPRYKGPKSVLWLEPGKIKTYDAAKEHHCAFWKKLYPEQLVH